MTTTPSSADTRRLIFAAALVCAAYYLAAQLGLTLRVWSTTPSVLWPPNALLTATLLLTPPRRWPLFLAAVAPVHFLVEAGTGWPLPLIGALFLTNCSEAVLGAGGVWLFGRSPRRLDNLRALLIFIASVVVVGPIVSSFLDAAAVTWLRGEPYWEVWRVRCLSNMLTELTVAPAVVGVVAYVLEGRRSSLSRWAEAGILTLGLVAAGAGSYSWRSAGDAVRAVGSYVPLAVELPFVLWAAVRFGPTGVSGALVLIAFTTIWTAAGGVGPFDRLPPEITVSALQVSLFVVAVPMLTLAVMLRERRDTGRELLGRLRFEELLSRLSGAFVQIPSDQMEGAFQTWLGRLCEFFEVDCVRLYRLDAVEQDMTVASTWAHPAFGDAPVIDARRDFPWTVSEILHRRPIVIEDVDSYPADAVRDRYSLYRCGFESSIAVPLLAGDRVVGALSFCAASRRAWSEELIGRVRLTCEVLGNALARKQTEDALRASELMKGAILSSLSSGVAVLDRSGRGIAVNDIWGRYAQESGMPCELLVRGDNFIDVWRAAGAAGWPAARSIADGIAALLEGRQPSFRHEYPAHGSPRWFVVSGFPFNRPEGGAVVILADVTDRRQAELDVQRARDQLAHVARVSTMGELTASIAHQLNQPLTGIMTNAQVLLRMVASPSVNLPEFRTILADIVDDDRRASEVIRRLIALLRKGESIHELVDVSGLVREVAKLLSSDATLRNVAIELALGSEPLLVCGDRVQLQQVVLNLIMNGMEAIADLDEERYVRISAHVLDEEVRISVRDSGIGLGDGADLEAFEPFYTTKSGGMGMGLSIARSIVESHDGSIRAMNSGPKGATVELTLPLATAGAQVPVARRVSTG